MGCLDPPRRPGSVPDMLSDLFPFFPRPGTAARLPLESGTVTDDLPKVSWKHARPLRLGDFEVLPASGELVGRRGIQRVRPLLMDIVLRLSAQPGEVVRPRDTPRGRLAAAHGE
jgi:hypothetical protein